MLRGIENIQYCDDAISFDQYFMTWPAPQGYTTGVKEVLRTLLRYAKFASDYVDALDSMLGNPAYDTDAKGLIKQIIERLETTPVQQRCCSAPLTQDLGKNRVTGVDSAKVAGVRFEDQHSREHGYHSLFKNKVSAVAFFYTRCQNPSKCSLTVTKLAALQRLVGHDNLQVVAITYDPEYDTPDRLRTYCEHRGMRFDDSTKALRSLGSSLDVIRDYFRLGASYSGSLVNAHQIELYLIDAQARVVGAFVNLQWQPQEVAREMYEIQVSRPIPAFP
ncbi:MAG: SCO family protein [Pseudomonadota bacterium]